MRSPIKMSFLILKPDNINLNDLQLKIMPKEFYIEKGIYDLFLVNEKSEIIAKGNTSIDKISRVMKAYYNGQKLTISKIEIDRKILISALISPN